MLHKVLSFFVDVQVNVTPFCVCRDHRVKSVVVCVRGTLSFKVISINLHMLYISHQN